MQAYSMEKRKSFGILIHWGLPAPESGHFAAFGGFVLLSKYSYNEKTSWNRDSERRKRSDPGLQHEKNGKSFEKITAKRKL